MLCRQEIKVVLAHDLKDLDVWIIFRSKEIGFVCEGFSGCSLLDYRTLPVASLWFQALVCS